MDPMDITNSGSILASYLVAGLVLGLLVAVIRAGWLRR
jgi:flagellar biosynthesis protein FliQ